MRSLMSCCFENFCSSETTERMVPMNVCVLQDTPSSKPCTGNLNLNYALQLVRLSASNVKLEATNKPPVQPEDTHEKIQTLPSPPESQIAAIMSRHVTP